MSVIDSTTVEQAERLAKACMKAFPRLQPYAGGTARPGKPGAVSPEEVDASVYGLLKQAANAGYVVSAAEEAVVRRLAPAVQVSEVLPAAVTGQVVDVQDKDGEVVGKAVVRAHEGAVLYVRLV